MSEQLPEGNETSYDPIPKDNAHWLARQEVEPVKIYQCFHKPYPHALCNWIQPLALGRFEHEGMISERTGENVAELNPFYNEIAAYYWIWKNAREPIVGLYHYRRVMGFKLDNAWADPFGFSMETSPFVLNYFSSDDQLASLHRLMSCSDAIIPRLTVTNGASAKQYVKVHDPESWQVFVQVLEEKLPHLMPYMPLFTHTNLVTAFNMFVMRRDTFGRYCQDLFSVVDTVFDRLGPRVHYYLRRYPGFLAERFMLIWMRHERLRVAEVPMILLDDGSIPEERKLFLS